MNRLVILLSALSPLVALGQRSQCDTPTAIRALKTGLSSAQIIKNMKSHKDCAFTLEPADVRELIKAGASDELLTAMEPFRVKSSPGSTTASTSTSAATTSDGEPRGSVNFPDSGDPIVQQARAYIEGFRVNMFITTQPLSKYARLTKLSIADTRSTGPSSEDVVFNAEYDVLDNLHEDWVRMAGAVMSPGPLVKGQHRIVNGIHLKFDRYEKRGWVLSTEN